MTDAELTYLRRALPHYLAGKSVVESMEAVLADDARLLSAAADTSHGYIGFNGAACSYVDQVARGLASQLSDAVYRRLRAATPSPDLERLSGGERL